MIEHYKPAPKDHLSNTFQSNSWVIAYVWVLIMYPALRKDSPMTWTDLIIPLFLPVDTVAKNIRHLINKRIPLAHMFLEPYISI